jgi:alkylation response protein AidB-like acyl-CoA dehydrogenase
MTETFEGIRASVRDPCTTYPGKYWRVPAAECADPKARVSDLTGAGYLASLIPEEYGGSGRGLPAAAAILEEIQQNGWNGPQLRKRLYEVAPISTNLIFADLAEHVLDLPCCSS